MADLEAVLADVSYLMAMEKSKCTPAARASKKIILPDPSVRSVTQKYLEKTGEVTFDKIFKQRLGFLLFKQYCEEVSDEPVPQLAFYEEIKRYEKLETVEERRKLAREIYDNFIMKELLSHTHSYSKESVAHVQKYLTKNEVPTHLFEPYIEEIFTRLRGDIFRKFVESDKYTRFCQWKNLELNIQLTMNDFSVHRIIGRGGFGEVYGCRKADTGKMYAMKCLDKKRIKMKQGETLALNERIMLLLMAKASNRSLYYSDDYDESDSCDSVYDGNSGCSQFYRHTQAKVRFTRTTSKIQHHLEASRIDGGSRSHLFGCLRRTSSSKSLTSLYLERNHGSKDSRMATEDDEHHPPTTHYKWNDGLEPIFDDGRRPEKTSTAADLFLSTEKRRQELERTREEIKRLDALLLKQKEQELAFESQQCTSSTPSPPPGQQQHYSSLTSIPDEWIDQLSSPTTGAAAQQDDDLAFIFIFIIIVLLGLVH